MPVTTMVSGARNNRRLAGSPIPYLVTVKTDHMALFSFDWLGTRAELSTKPQALVAGVFSEILLSSSI